MDIPRIYHVYTTSDSDIPCIMIYKDIHGISSVDIHGISFKLDIPCISTTFNVGSWIYHVYTWIYHVLVYTRHIGDIPIVCLGYTWYIPGIYWKSGFQMYAITVTCRLKSDSEIWIVARKLRFVENVSNLNVVPGPLLAHLESWPVVCTKFIPVCTENKPVCTML